MRKLLWEPSAERKQAANMTRFIAFVNQKYGLDFSNFNQLYDWSVTRNADFWAAMWEFGGIRASRPYEAVVTDFEDMIGSKWFTGAELNFAENLLRYRDDRMALIFKGEGQPSVRLTYAQLYDQVARLAASLRRMGVQAGDRVAGFMPNMLHTPIAMLAATSIGAVWSSCSPDFGIKGVLDRFGQIRPKVLFTANGYFYNGKQHDSLERVAGVIKEIPSIERVVVVPYTEANPDLAMVPGAVLYADFLAKEDGLEIEFAQLPFDHPVYIMYSSGTTGLPKCMVHGAGGTLIQHLKELMLHTDLKREDTIFYYTTCGWMMWNWLISSLAVGATLLLYDGSPFYPDAGGLWQLAQDEKISIFGTSAKYLAAVEKAGVKPGSEYDLTPLKAVLSTGSPLSVESFEFVYREIKQDLCLSSISGGTDIVSCFALGNPIGPVYAGELQCRGLGMKVQSFDANGRPVLNQKGELVCTASFPSMPIYFWDDPDGEKYRKAYFDVYPNVWRHGDFIEINDDGGVVIYGRSDATLNPGGVRIGTAEIYRQVEALPEILDSLVVGQEWDNDVRVVLFVKPAPGVEFNEALVNKIKSAIRENTTPRHVPARVIPVADIPYTISGKKVEMAVRDIIHNREVSNRDALANPEALELYRNQPALQS
ncbi:acetoacetate--CoA ligase [Desulfotomaculum copahuensis]|uniref:Acetoacetate-CoA ligase n=1 Tax=Desulfotomaculum copahuensis TaxID=1838280 RepID=A0A1B7LCR4_9FIRM|nr:acetoacetate--CoA ligase [Desulfotomaculum copahuensis]OAT80663.1 acetoacetate-CoA ligase [Desulfotomaculum copahuensis]